MQQILDRVSYGAELAWHIARHVKRVRGWHVSLDYMSGSLYLCDHLGAHNLSVYATPLWDDAEHDLDVQLDDDGFAETFHVSVAWTGEIAADCARWVHVVATVLATIEATRALAA